MSNAKRRHRRRWRVKRRFERAKACGRYYEFTFTGYYQVTCSSPGYISFPMGPGAYLGNPGADASAVYSALSDYVVDKLYDTR